MTSHPNRNKSKRKLTLGLSVFTGDVGPGSAKHSAVGWSLLGNWESGTTKKLPDHILNKPGKVNIIVYERDQDLTHFHGPITAKDHKQLVFEKVAALEQKGWQINIINFDSAAYFNWLGAKKDSQESRSKWAVEQ